MLTSYITATQNLLQAPGSPSNLYPTGSLTTWINTARGQLAGEAECIRLIGTLALVAGTSVYNFSAISITATGVATSSPFKINTAWLQIAAGSDG